MALMGHDLYLRFSNNKTVQHFRVWDSELFLTARMEEGLNAKKEEERFTVSTATEEEYRGDRWRR